MKKMNIFTAVLMLALALLVAGCATSGTNFDVNEVQKIEKNVTTRAELESTFGKPYSVGFDGDGRQTATWIYVKASNQAQNFVPVVGLVAGAVDLHQKQLIAVFDEAGVVVDYNYNVSDSENKFGIVR